jgi:predicted ribosomally synthesized peptide with nif11-like leader
VLQHRHHLTTDIAINISYTLQSPMSEEQLNAFLEKVKGDTSLQDKLKAAASPEAAIEIAKDAGFAITAEDIQSMKSATVELSDEELEGAAGGFDHWVSGGWIIC